MPAPERGCVPHAGGRWSRVAGVYSDPSHVLVDPDDTVHQQLVLCFHAVSAPIGVADQFRPDDEETDAAAWFSTTDIVDLKIQPAMWLGSITPSVGHRTPPLTRRSGDPAGRMLVGVDDL